MLNYQCFEKLAMTGDSSKSDNVREYFIKLREFLVENQKIIYQYIFLLLMKEKIIFLKLVEL